MVRALASHARGHRFESCCLHQKNTHNSVFFIFHILLSIKAISLNKLSFPVPLGHTARSSSPRCKASPAHSTITSKYAQGGCVFDTNKSTKKNTQPCVFLYAFLKICILKFPPVPRGVTLHARLRLAVKRVLPTPPQMKKN